MGTRPRRRWGPFLREAAGDDLVLARESTWLVLLSVADLITTYALMRHGVGAYEANPIANWWFARWNVAGLAAFKFAAIAGVIVVAEYAERRKPWRGRVVLWLGIAATAVVFLKGLSLYARHVLPILG
jgi:hypothetical protein